MVDAHRLDCEAAENNCRFIVQSEDENEAISLAQNHMQAVHGKQYTEDQLRSDHLQVV